MNREKILSSVKEAVLEVAPKADIILFGSRSRGDFREESDWDFLILVEEKVEKKEREIRSRLYDIEVKTDQVISVIIHSKAKWESIQITPLYKTVKHEGERV